MAEQPDWKQHVQLLKLDVMFCSGEKDHLGGLSTFISDLPSKTRMKDFPKYLEARAARLKNLYVFLNTEATVEKVKQFKPDIVVNATGSVPLVPPIKGLKETSKPEMWLRSLI